MILPSARLWYEGKTKDLEEVLQEAQAFHLSGYARLAFPGSGQSFIILQGGAIKEIMEIGPTNKPAPKSLKDLWGKSKIKSGLLQVFEIPPEVNHFLSRISGREEIIHAGSAISELKEWIIRLRRNQVTRIVDVLTPDGKGLLVIESQVINACYFTENEGFTLTDFPAFKRLAAAIGKHRVYSAFSSAIGGAGESTPWLPILLCGASYEGTWDNLRDRLVEKFGRNYAPGTVLFKDNDPGDDFYLIIGGTVAIFKEKGGRKKLLAELGPGEFFGEMAIFNKAPRTATAACIDECQLIKVDADTMRSLLYNSYDFRVTMVRKLAKRLKDTVDEMVRLWEDPRAIYMEKIIFQIISADPRWQEEGIAPGLLMQEIANLSGLRFSEIDGVFRKLLESGKIEFVRGRVVMKEPSLVP